MSQKKKVILIAALVVVVAIGVVIAVGAKGTDKQNNKETNSSGQQDSQADDEAALLGETVTDPQAGVTMRLPKGWKQVPKSTDNRGSIAKFQESQPTGSAPATGELTARKSTRTLEEFARGAIEAGLNFNIGTEILEHKDVTIEGKPARLLNQEIPGPNGQSDRLAQYIFPREGTYYTLSFIVLSSDWEAQKAAIDASVKSLQFTQ